MIDIESKIISCREDTNDYRLCLTREEIEEIKNAWNDGYYQGATDMEEAKQIIIDSLLKQMEHIRAEAIDEVINEIIEQYGTFNCDVCKRKTESCCTFGDCTITFLEQVKEHK